MTKIKNGDIFNIGQTVNGVDTFLFKEGKWYYHSDQLKREYEYDQEELTQLILRDELMGFDEVTLVGNIFE